MIYTGIGHRKIPNYISDIFFKVGALLGENGFILRSGGAVGSDSAFEKGCDSVNGKKEIYLPYKGFNNNNSSLYDVGTDAINYASRLHPYWNRKSRIAKLLLARNVYQILGLDLSTPTDLIVCYCEARPSGTTFALKIANKYKQIYVLNLADVLKYPQEDTDKVLRVIKKHFKLESKSKG